MSADVDIDFADRQQIIDLIKCTPARQRTADGMLPKKHASGVYVTPIPYDPQTGCAAISFEAADDRGYFKLDLLNMSVYSLIRDQAHYDNLLAQQPQWQLMWEQPGLAEQLVHVGNYAQLLKEMQPDSIPRMAAFISIIRPGKAHLKNKPWDEVFASVWDGDSSDGFVFKKSHAVSYAKLVALHLNLLCEQA
jgi:hypothetical protein